MQQCQDNTIRAIAIPGLRLLGASIDTTNSPMIITVEKYNKIAKLFQPAYREVAYHFVSLYYLDFNSITNILSKNYNKMSEVIIRSALNKIEDIGKNQSMSYQQFIELLIEYKMIENPGFVENFLLQSRFAKDRNNSRKNNPLFMMRCAAKSHVAAVNSYIRDSIEEIETRDCNEHVVLDNNNDERNSPVDTWLDAHIDTRLHLLDNDELYTRKLLKYTSPFETVISMPTYHHYLENNPYDKDIEHLVKATSMSEKLADEFFDRHYQRFSPDVILSNPIISEKFILSHYATFLDMVVDDKNPAQKLLKMQLNIIRHPKVRFETLLNLFGDIEGLKSIISKYLTISPFSTILNIV